MPITRCQLAKRLAGFIDMNRRANIRLAKPRTIYQSRYGPLAKRLARLVVPVKSVAFDRHE